jgi:hypothetical protein
VKSQQTVAASRCVTGQHAACLPARLPAVRSACHASCLLSNVATLTVFLSRIDDNIPTDSNNWRLPCTELHSTKSHLPAASSAAAAAAAAVVTAACRATATCRSIGVFQTDQGILPTPCLTQRINLRRLTVFQLVT